MVVKERLLAERDEEEKQKPENLAGLALIVILAFGDCCVSVIFCQKYWCASKINCRFCLPYQYQLIEASEIRAREHRDRPGSGSVAKGSQDTPQGEMDSRVKKGNQLRASSL